MNDLLLFAGTSNLPLAKAIAKELKTELGEMKISFFKDGENYCRPLTPVQGKDVFIIQSTSPHVNDNLMQLMIALDALKRSSPKRITAVIPYFGYARQERKVKPQEPITAKLVADFLSIAGANRVVTIDLHSGTIVGFFNNPVDDLTSVPIIGEELKKRKFKDAVVVAPDAGAVKMARRMAKELNCGTVLIDKRRDKPNEVAEMLVVGNVKDKTCILYDDMIDTGGTIAKAAKTLKEKGAGDVYVCTAHAVFSEPAVERLQDNAIKEVIICDTINQENLPPKFKVVTVAKMLSETIKKIHEEKK